jgi:hypothetical protein
MDEKTPEILPLYYYIYIGIGIDFLSFHGVRLGLYKCISVFSIVSTRE